MQPKPKFLSVTLLKITTKGKKIGRGNFRWLMIYLPRAGYPLHGVDPTWI